MKIVADDKIPYIKGVLEPFAQVVYVPGRAIGVRDVRDADVLLVRTRTRCDEALLGGSRVSMVATATIGLDHIDTEWCRAHGVEVASAPGCNAGGVLQWVAASLAGVVKKFGKVPSSLTIGIVGVGHVGSLVERYAREWGFGVLCSDPPREAREGLGRSAGFVPLEELARRADIVTFHVPMTRSGAYPTAGIGGEEFFARLKPGAAILNSSRGGIVDEEALKRALRSKECIACIDTWEDEPDIDRELLRLSLFSTPHVAGYSREGKANASAAVVEAAAARFSLPLEGWYPAEVKRVSRIPISWEEICSTIRGRFDIEEQSRILKANPEQFEHFRENYAYREEYF